MNLLTRLFTRSSPPSDLPTRSPATGVFMPSPRTVERNSRRAQVERQLEDYVAGTTRAQRKAETDRYFARMRSGERLSPEMERKLFRGMGGGKAGAA